jgi:uncharacterized membrane protein (UPF0136 family)
MTPKFGWSLVVVAVIGGLIVALQSGANPQLAGYSMGPAFAWTIIAIVAALLAGRRESRERKARIFLLMGVVVLGIHAWYAYRTWQVGAEEMAVAASRVASDRISAAAVAEMTAIAQGAIDEVSPAWQPYAEPEAAVALGDRSVALQDRLVELTRRQRLRDVEFSREFARATRDSGMDIVLDSGRLLDPAGRDAALRQMDAYGQYLASLESQMAERHELLRADFRELGLSKATESAGISGHERAIADTAPVMAQMVDQSDQLLAKIKDLVLFASEHAATAKQADDALQFSDAAVQAEYLRRRAEIDPLLQTP